MPIALFLIKQNLILILASHAIHPADDPLAKWDLLNLFNDSLEAPIYLGSLTNCN